MNVMMLDDESSFQDRVENCLIYLHELGTDRGKQLYFSRIYQGLVLPLETPNSVVFTATQIPSTMHYDVTYSSDMARWKSSNYSLRELQRRTRRNLIACRPPGYGLGVVDPASKR